MLTIQHSGPDGEITTTFEYDGIQQLVRVTDTEGNVTTSTYDMGDRRTEVNHPASGITSFTYDALGKNASGNQNAIFNPEFQMLGKNLLIVQQFKGIEKEWSYIILRLHMAELFSGDLFLTL